MYALKLLFAWSLNSLGQRGLIQWQLAARALLQANEDAREYGPTSQTCRQRRIEQFQALVPAPQCPWVLAYQLQAHQPQGRSCRGANLIPPLAETLDDLISMTQLLWIYALGHHPKVLQDLLAAFAQPSN